MRKYELVTIFDVDVLSIDENKKFITDTLTTGNIKIESEQDMGQKELAYPINEKKRGHYFLFNLETEQADLIEIEKAFKLHKGLLRYLFIRKKK